ncbi:MAG: fibronectin type III domain-containing protein [Paludibacteraceae bacterium]|nr:fibronectin type III domain-containing protein [Paludibacteraceae bacterium]MBN2787015.1 fibronectin type III domain-containing protein [Paludibacteraceae bacterium]
MKKASTSIKRGITSSLLILILGFSSFSVFSQKDILLYSTDFTDWTAANYTSASSDDVFPVSTGAGEGFVLADKAIVNPTGTIDGETGYMEITNGPNTGFLTKEFNFVAGGAIELLVCTKTSSNSRFITVDGVDAVMIEAPVPVPGSSRYDRIGVGNGTATTIVTNMMGASNTVLDPAKVGVYHSGSNWISSDGSTAYKVTFRFPTSFTGPHKLLITQHKDIAIAGMKIYTGVGNVTPYVASTNYSQDESSAHVLTGLVGGAAFSGTPSNAKIKVKEWNNGTNNVTLTLEGADASKFSFSNTTAQNTLTVPGAEVANPSEKEIDIYFSPSVRAGVAKAIVKIEAPGVAQPYYVHITGVTGGTTPQIVASTATLPFWASLIATTTNTIDIAGLNLTGDVTLSIDGPNAGQFELSKTTISKANASAGATVTITYTGNIVAGDQTASLHIQSAGAPEVVVPLAGFTSDLKPTMYDISFSVSPGGTAYVDTEPAGTRFKEGTEILVTVTPENGWKVDQWSDAAGNKRSVRTYVLSDLNKGHKIVYMVPGVQPVDPNEEEEGSLVGYKPEVTESSMLINWSPVTGATSYTLTVYDEFNSILASYPVAVSETTATVTGLTSGTLYKYSLSTTVGPDTHNTGILGPYRTTPVYNCGEGH